MKIEMFELKGDTLFSPSWCSFSMMVKWANDGLLQANAECSSMMLKWVYAHMYTHFTIIDEHFTIINKHFLAYSWSKPSYANLTIIEKLHRLSPHLVNSVYISFFPIFLHFFHNFFLSWNLDGSWIRPCVFSA